MKTKITQVQQQLFVRSAIAAAITSAFAPGVALAQDAAATAESTELEKVEVTGSRLGRADIEGALPVAVISREDIDRSGFTSVGELLRNTTFNSLGAFRAQSGSSAQSLVAVDLRGLGSERTLVLIDGRRAPKAPYAPTAQDLNAVPIAIVERIEVLKDGASAIYGSDAIAGVVNIITRKNYSGAQLSYQQQGSERKGGDSKGAQFVAGTTTETANLVFGASYFDRDIIFARNSLFNSPGGSFFSNNYILSGFTDGDGDFFDDNTGNYYYGAVPGGCPNQDPNFYITAAPTAYGNCGYNFNRVAADEAATANQGVFARADFAVTDNWRMKVQGSVTRATSFGRYAPSLNDVPLFVTADNPNNTLGQDFFLYHRFAALGTRDNDTDAHVYDLTGVMTGEVGEFNVTGGIRHNEYQYYELGRNYVVLPIAQSFIDSGDYNFLAPLTADENTLKAMKATIGRDSFWRTLEYFAEANTPIFDMQGGSAAVAVGAEYRTEKYFDAYDSLSEGGAIGGSAGNSSGTHRKVKALYVELFLPVMDTLEVSVSGRHEDYNDVGESTVPKVSARFQPTDQLTLRASVGQGFRAPTLDIISALPTFSAESINNDEATCVAAGGVFSNPGGSGTCNVQSQVNTTIISNPALAPEESDQFSFGVAFDITDGIDVSVDYYNIALTDRLNFIEPSEIIDRIGSGDPIPPGLGVTRSAVIVANGQGRITQVIAGYANEGDLDTSGLDIEANAKVDLGPAGGLDTSFLTNYILEYKIDSGRDLVGDPAVPQYRATLNNTWTPPIVQGVTVAFNGNHIADQAQSVTAGQQVGHIPSYTTWDLQVAYDLPFIKGSNIAVGALNVFNKEPSPKSAFDGRDYNFYLYDQYGTQPYFKYTHTF